MQSIISLRYTTSSAKVPHRTTHPAARLPRATACCWGELATPRKLLGTQKKIILRPYPTVPPSLATEPDCFAVLLCARDTDLCDPTVRPQTGTAALYDTSIKTIQVGSDPDNLSRKLLEDVMLCFYESCCADGVTDRMKTVNARPLRRLL